MLKEINQNLCWLQGTTEVENKFKLLKFRSTEAPLLDLNFEGSPAHNGRTQPQVQSNR